MVFSIFYNGFSWGDVFSGNSNFACLVCIVAVMRSVSKSSSILYAMYFLMAMAVSLCGESS